MGDLSCLAWTYTQKKSIIREQSENQKALRADLLIRGVWSPQETASFDIRVTDTEAKSYSNRNPEDVLESCADEKRRKYSEACQEKHIAITPLFVSVDGMMARESKIFLRRLAHRLASKWDKPYSIIMNWVKNLFYKSPNQQGQQILTLIISALMFCHPMSGSIKLKSN